MKAQALSIRKPKKSLEYSKSFKAFPLFSHYRNPQIHQILATENRAMEGGEKITKEKA